MDEIPDGSVVIYFQGIFREHAFCLLSFFVSLFIEDQHVVQK